MRDVNETIGARIRRLRKEKNMTLSSVGARIRMHTSYVGQVERNEHEPGLMMAAELSKLFGVSLDYIAGLTDREQNPYVKRSSA
ncbi:helix-turn-helix protein [Paraburkholderia sp. BL6669N2]|uniref:helix-turn-helix domain-containing protein n=1 Tax=Paraburkholderia sp. BL6669N2 TaxID=1938807 RepID=UPI000E39D5B0|nr:helix-turn-helix transcriptional regulator [Paraburkholderia sp. BL6669N2]REG57743.1 helix-turn-helix protein [Paraburkholderia sp. BL6669N2]